MMAKKMTINLNILRMLINYGILCNLDGTLIIAVKRGGDERETPSRTEAIGANYFRSSRFRSMVFSLTLERAITDWFLLLKEVKESPRTQKPEVDYRSEIPPAQSS